MNDESFTFENDMTLCGLHIHLTKHEYTQTISA